MTIQTVEELNVDPGVTIERPQPNKYTPFDICYKTTHEEETDQTAHPASRKLLFIYTAKTNSNEIIQVMADPGATLSILNRRALTKVGPWEDNGTTRLKGLANNQVGPAAIKKFNMTSSFGSKWINKEVDAAVLNVISTLQSEDLTQAICTVLKCIEENRPDLMAKHKNILKLKHFQRFRVQGDVDLLLGVDRQSMHTRPLIMFNQDIAICYV